MSRPMSASEHMTPITTNGFEQVSVVITSASTLKSLLTGAVIPADARHAIFYPEDNDVRWRADGTAPTVDIGIVMEKDALHVFENQRGIFDNMQVISGDASSASTLNVHWFK
jgi:hypothetical protein